MSATRRLQTGRLGVRKTPASGVTAAAATDVKDAVQNEAPASAIDPVCADPAVVLWDEVAAPDPSLSEDTSGKAGVPASDRTLH